MPRNQNRTILLNRTAPEVVERRKLVNARDSKLFTTEPTLVGELEEGMWFGMPLSATKIEMSATFPPLHHMNYERIVKDGPEWDNSRIYETCQIAHLKRELMGEKSVQNAWEGARLPALKMKKKENYIPPLWIIPAGTHIDLIDERLKDDKDVHVRPVCITLTDLPSRLWEFPVVGDEFHIFLSKKAELTGFDPKSMGAMERGACFLSEGGGDTWYEVHSPTYDNTHRTWSRGKLWCFVFRSDQSPECASHLEVPRRVIFPDLCSRRFYVDPRTFSAIEIKSEPNVYTNNYMICRLALARVLKDYTAQVAKSDKAMAEMIKADASVCVPSTKKKKKKKKRMNEEKQEEEVVEGPKLSTVSTKTDVTQDDVETPLMRRAYAMGTIDDNNTQPPVPLQGNDGGASDCVHKDVSASVCVICLDEEATHLMVPCGHQCLCGHCALNCIPMHEAEWKECPYCSQPVGVQPIRVRPVLHQ